MPSPVTGFSKKTKEEKIQWLLENYLDNDVKASKLLKSYWNNDQQLQKRHDDFIENTLTNYYLPLGIAPNFLINDQLYALPMVIEESSVVAAASNAAKFWLDRGGFKAEVVSSVKNGQVHINYFGKDNDIDSFFAEVKPKLIDSIADIQKNMKRRGGGLLELSLINKAEHLAGYYQLHATFETLDAMGANFINSCLETMARTFEIEAREFRPFQDSENYPEVALSILSNYVPECLVRAEVSCEVSKLTHNGYEGRQFAEKFVRAVEIAHAEPRRAVTHNKGIMNGVDAVILATGNDFRAVEAGIHAYAARKGSYGSLTRASLEGELFRFWIEIPLALGTVGGLTTLHPLVQLVLKILQKPNAHKLMEIVAVAGLAQNFAAVRSLVTTGIQKGHMKMHLMNILNQLEATSDEKEKTVLYFEENMVTHSAVEQFVASLRA